MPHCWGGSRRATENGPRSLACRPSADKRKLGTIELSNMAAVDYYSKVVRGSGKGRGCLRASAHIVGEAGGRREEGRGAVGPWSACRFQALITWSLIALIIFHFLRFVLCCTPHPPRRDSTQHSRQLVSCPSAPHYRFLCCFPAQLLLLFAFQFQFHTFHFASFACRI